MAPKICPCQHALLIWRLLIWVWLLVLPCKISTVPHIYFRMDTGIIGSVTVMESYISEFGPQSATVHGLIVSAILIPAAVASFFAGRVADVLGRPKGIAIGALIFGLGSGLEAGAIHIAMFVVGRITEGVGEGLYLGTLVVQVDLFLKWTLLTKNSYICEISPPNQRGPLATGPQLLVTLGLVVGYFTCYGSATIDSSLAWRTPFIVLTSLSIAFAIASLLWLVPSPRWLVLRGRRSKASAAWDALGVDHSARESAGTEAPASPGHAPELATRHRLLDVFAKDVRSRTSLAIFLLFMQQLSGIDGVLYVSSFKFIVTVGE